MSRTADDIADTPLPFEARRAHGHGFVNPIDSPTALDTRPIEPLLTLIKEAWSPDAIWLFGSRARGEAEPSSDWDLLVVVPDQVVEHARDPFSGWELRRRAGVRADIVACSAAEFAEGCSMPNTLAFEASHHGVLLHGS